MSRPHQNRKASVSSYQSLQGANVLLLFLDLFLDFDFVKFDQPSGKHDASLSAPISSSTSVSFQRASNSACLFASWARSSVTSACSLSSACRKRKYATGAQAEEEEEALPVHWAGNKETKPRRAPLSSYGTKKVFLGLFITILNNNGLI